MSTHTKNLGLHSGSSIPRSNRCQDPHHTEGNRSEFVSRFKRKRYINTCNASGWSGLQLIIQGLRPHMVQGQEVDTF